MGIIEGLSGIINRGIDGKAIGIINRGIDIINRGIEWYN